MSPGPIAVAPSLSEILGEQDPAPRPRAGPSRPRAGNRRGEGRTPCVLPAIITELDRGEVPGRSFPGTTVDISRSGMGLISNSMVHEGRRILIEVGAVKPGPGGSAGTRGKLLCGTVRHMVYEPGRGYTFGIELGSLPKSSEMRLWMHKQGHPWPAWG